MAQAISRWMHMPSGEVGIVCGAPPDVCDNDCVMFVPWHSLAQPAPGQKLACRLERAVEFRRIVITAEAPQTVTTPRTVQAPVTDHTRRLSPRER